MAAEERRQVRAADLLLALEQELDVERQAALLPGECLGGLQDDVDGSLVVGRAPPAHDIAVDGQLERRAVPVGEVAGPLDVVVAVYEDRRRPGGTNPFAPDQGMTLGPPPPAARA